MARRKYYDFGIRPKGSQEFSVDCLILMQIVSPDGDSVDMEERIARRSRVIDVYNFLVKTALSILPPKQREIFYSVWVRSGGKMNKGIMDFSRRTGRSHYTSYNNYYKSLNSLQAYLKRTGYDVFIIEYLQGDREDL